MRSMKNNAVVFIGQVWGGGVVRHLALLAAEVAKIAGRAYDFYFASIARESNPGSWSVIRGVLPNEKIVVSDDFVALVKKIDGIVRLYERVVVHFGGGWSQTRCFIPLKRKYGERVKFVITTHSYRLDSWQRVPMSMLQYFLYSKFVDKVIFQCPYAASRFAFSQRLFLRNRAVIIPLGCEPFSTEGALDQEPEIFKTSGVSEFLNRKNTITLVYLAAMRPGKNHAWLVKALAPIMKEDRRIQLLLCGRDNEKITASLRKIITSMDVQHNVLMPGMIPRNYIPYLLTRVDVAVVPSRAETFGHNFLEPMMAGIPVVGTRVGVGEYLVRDYETGLGFSLDDGHGIRNAVRFLLKHPAATRVMGENAKKIASEHFTHKRVASMHNSLYMSVMGVLS